MDVRNADYKLTAVRPDQYPKATLPEIAFVGRSNVGKSSIINVLLNRRNLARKSATPGKTREINFYIVPNQCYFVDLPGYGYAKVSKDARIAWDEMIGTYLNTRPTLTLLIMLLDIRHAPSADDKTMYEWLKHQEIPFFLVATKLDKIPKGSVQKQLQLIAKELRLTDEDILIPFSAETRNGREEIMGLLDQVLTK